MEMGDEFFPKEKKKKEEDLERIEKMLTPV